MKRRPIAFEWGEHRVEQSLAAWMERMVSIPRYRDCDLMASRWCDEDDPAQDPEIHAFECQTRVKNLQLSSGSD